MSSIDRETPYRVMVTEREGEVLNLALKMLAKAAWSNGDTGSADFAMSLAVRFHPNTLKDAGA